MNDLSLPQPESPIQAAGKTFGIRAGAHIIDLVLYVVASFAIQFMVGIIIGIALAISGREFYFDEESTQWLNFVIGLIIGAVYFAVFEWLYGATLGKVILGMRVIRENGEPCSFGPAFTRALLRYVDGLFFGLPALATMKAPLQQRIGDKAAKTVVVSAQDPIIRQPRAWWWFLVAAGLYLALDGIVTFFMSMAAIR
jgi:uncharacterized RDD family membrane protein YckC